jgi:transcriptional regulator with XRE-family HTH domain
MSIDDAKIAIAPEQCRAARGLLGWSQDHLVEKSGVSKRTIVRFELEDGEPFNRTVVALHSSFQKAGILFIEQNGGGIGVRFRKRKR